MAASAKRPRLPTTSPRPAAAPGYRNGYGKARRLAMSSGTITLRRPRVRGVEERFESRVLPLFARRTKELGALLPELYLHGLAEGDFELAMRGTARRGGTAVEVFDSETAGGMDGGVRGMEPASPGGP